MAVLHKDHKNSDLQTFLDTDLPKVTGKTKVWDAFLKWAGHDADATKAAAAARTAVAKGQGPTIKVAAIPSGGSAGFDAGEFRHADPNAVYLDPNFVAFFSKLYGDSATKSKGVDAAESTILHEMVHLLNYKFHKKTKFGLGEMGKAFEVEAYGRDLVVWSLRKKALKL